MGDDGDGNAAMANVDGEEEKTQHPGEYNPEESAIDNTEAETATQTGGDTTTDADAAENEPPTKKSKKSKKKKVKTQITFQEYQIISTAIATYLRAKEGESTDDDGKPTPTFLTWV